MIALFAATSLFSGLPDLPNLPPITRAAQLTYVDRGGAVIGVRGGKVAPTVDLDKLPAYVPAAVVAIEDRRFYEHQGFDAIGIARAIVTDVQRGHAAQGASTITQQLARNLFLSQDRTVERKATELVYAMQLERKYSKKQILSLYLSRVYFGSGAYGIEAASRRFFGHSAAKLTLREAATLAGVLKSPTNYNPINNRERSDERARLVLDVMVQTGAITPAQRSAALAKPLKVRRAASVAAAEYFVDWADSQARRLVGAVNQDIVVETTLDGPLETAVADAAEATVDRARPQGVEQAAVAAVDGAGRVRAMVGGVDYAASSFNRAVLARRQAGSAWKPFVYLAALEAGRAPETQVVDEPVTIGTWTPRNYAGTYLGPITLAQALAQSSNVVAVRLADEVGRDRVAAAARRVGIGSAINTDPAMALGTAQVSPLELASAYAAFANGGARVSPYGVERIRTAAGAVLYQRRAPVLPLVVRNPPLSDLNRMMRGVISGGTGVRAAFPGYDIAGKTGTTTDYKDAWFAGYTGGLSLVVWLGRDDASPMQGVTGGSAPATLWRTAMLTAVKRLPVSRIPPGAPAPVVAPPAVAAPLNAAPAAPVVPLPLEALEPL